MLPGDDLYWPDEFTLGELITEILNLKGETLSVKTMVFGQAGFTVVSSFIGEFTNTRNLVHPSNTNVKEIFELQFDESKITLHFNPDNFARAGYVKHGSDKGTLALVIGTVQDGIYLFHFKKDIE